jgi:hypothetical protein
MPTSTALRDPHHGDRHADVLQVQPLAAPVDLRSVGRYSEVHEGVSDPQQGVDFSSVRDVGVQHHDLRHKDGRTAATPARSRSNSCCLPSLPVRRRRPSPCWDARNRPAPRGAMSRNATGTGSRSTGCSDAGSARPGLAADLGETAGLRRCRRADHLDGVGGLHHKPGPPTRCRCPPCPDKQVEPPGPGPADHGLGRSRGGLDHQDPPDLRTGPKATVAGPHGRPARDSPPCRCSAGAASPLRPGTAAHPPRPDPGG